MHGMPKTWINTLYVPYNFAYMYYFWATHIGFCVEFFALSNETIYGQMSNCFGKGIVNIQSFGGGKVIWVGSHQIASKIY